MGRGMVSGETGRCHSENGTMEQDQRELQASERVKETMLPDTGSR